MPKLLETLPKVRVGPLREHLREAYKSLPETAGVYVYFKDAEVIYIGKAINLRRRISSYFDLDLEPKTDRMISSANYLSFIQVESELESLLLEARLIRKYMPRYNIAAKDDKHPLYIRITKESFPRIVTARKIAENDKNIAFYGPFPSGANVKSVLKLIRRIFPYSDHKIGARPCLYSHIGLCNPCPSEIVHSTQYKVLKKTYLKNIKHIKSILDGNIVKLSKSLEKEMNVLSKAQDYEGAAALRNKIAQLEYITSPQMPTEFYMENPNLYEDNRHKETNQLKNLLAQKNVNLRKLARIECFDIAHLAGTYVTASMVTFIDAEANKNFYRHFKIKTAKGGDDYAALREVAKRRAKHFTDWGKPDLIIVDGGAGQVNAFTSLLYSIKADMPVVGIAKHPDRLIVGNEKIKLEGAALNLVSRMRDEAHRFARRYHHSLIFKSIRQSNTLKNENTA